MLTNAYTEVESWEGGQTLSCSCVIKRCLLLCISFSFLVHSPLYGLRIRVVEQHVAVLRCVYRGSRLHACTGTGSPQRVLHKQVRSYSYAARVDKVEHYI